MKMNLFKMFLPFAFTALFVTSCNNKNSSDDLAGENLTFSTVEDGGTGAYKAIMVSEAGLPDYTIYRPEDLPSAVKKEGKLPVILFGNGGCALSSRGFEKFLTELASHGYLVIAIGPYAEYTEQQMPPAPPANAQAQPQGNRDSLMRAQMIAQFGDPANQNAESPQKEQALGLLKALDWLAEQNSTKNSSYYRKTDTENVAAMGQSCGGLQALVLGTSGDARIKTVVALNSGVTNPGDFLSNMISREDLNSLHTPVIYIIGGPDDMAHKNAYDDFQYISNVPVVFSNYPAGHGGTYRESHGGTFSLMAVTWLDWQLKGKEENKTVFTEKKLDTFPEGWSLESKNFQ